MTEHSLQFKVDINPGAKEVELIGPLLKLRSQRGYFWLEVRSLVLRFSSGLKPQVD